MGDTYLSYQSDNAITVRSNVPYLAVDKIDWERLKRDINQCKMHYDWWATAGSIAMGIAGSAFCSYLPLRSDNNYKNVCLVLLLVTVFSAIFAVVCFIARRTNVKILYKNIDDVKLDIHDIELKLQHE